MMRVILSLICALVVAVVVGGLLYLADSIGFYLILLMPLLAGTLIGFATYLPALPGRVPTFPLLVIALVGCVVAAGVYWGATYVVGYQQSFMDEASSRFPEASDEELRQFLSEVELQETGTTGFPAMLSFLAEQGLSISRATSSSSDSGILLEGNLVYGYWILEIVLMIGVAMVSVARRYTTKMGQKYAQPEPVPVPVAAASDDPVRW
jgi:hypothetical protein